MFNLIYFEINELLTVLARTWCRQSRPWQHWVPASQGNTLTSHLQSKQPPVYLWLPRSPLPEKSDLEPGHSQTVPALLLKATVLGHKVLFTSTEGNTKFLMPQTLSGVWIAIASDFAELSVSLCLHYLVSQTSSVTALPSVCPTPLLACSLA